jgi:hypothetical protein
MTGHYTARGDRSSFGNRIQEQGQEQGPRIQEDRLNLLLPLLLMCLWSATMIRFAKFSQR